MKLKANASKLNGRLPRMFSRLDLKFNKGLEPMNETKARTWITIWLLGGNLITFLVVLTLWLSGGFSSVEFKQIILLLTPLLFAYGLPVLRSALASRSITSGNNQNITATAFWLLVAIPPFVQVMTVSLCILKAFNIGMQSFDDFSIALGSVQTLFGAFTGLVVSTLFGSSLTEPVGKSQLQS